LAGGDHDRPIYVYGIKNRGWDGYNLTLRVLHAGYHKVFWIRDGLAGWLEQGLPLSIPGDGTTP